MIERLTGLSLMLTAMPLMANEAPLLTMYIFNRQAADQVTVATPETDLASTDSSDNEPVLQMQVFSDEDKSDTDVIFSTVDEFAFNYQVDAGYRTEKLSWNVASPAGSPNPLTQVKWNDVTLWRLQGQFGISLPLGVLVKGRGSYGWTVSGSGQETSYAQDHRQRPFSQRDSDASSGYGWDLSLALGYPFTLKFAEQPWQLTLTPLAGYQWQKQRWDLNNGRDVLASGSGLRTNQHSLYNTRWRGPWLGMDMTLGFFSRHQWFSSFEHHWARYQASADWQQARQLQSQQSFQHQTDATGMVVSTGYRYRFPESVGISVSVDYARWRGGIGNEQLTLANGQGVNSQLNEVDREALGFNLGVNWDF